MHIGLLTGTFDPIHTGHIQTAKNVLSNIKDIEQIWILPELRNPFKDGDETSYEHRLDMCRLAVHNYHNIYVSDAEYEISQKLNKNNIFTSEVIDNLPENNDYYLIIGADCVDRFYMWNNYKSILDNNKLVVVTRPSFNIDLDNKKVSMVLEHPNTILLDCRDSVDISSTEIRSNFKSGNRVTGISEAVGNYIEKNKLYL